MDHSRKRGTTGALAALALAGAALSGCGGPDGTTLTITRNAIEGGKNDSEAQWITRKVIPGFVAAQKAKGVTVKVRFRGTGVADEAYKTRIALDLKSRSGADVLDVDGIWVGEFVQAGYLKPLNELAGAAADSWEGWSRIPKAVQGLATFDGRRYGIPPGTDGRLLYYNKKLFTRAGLPTNWQPKSWDDILTAARALKKLPDVTPIQLNAGTAMGEATTTQGVLPLLAGAGAEIHQGGKWTGGGPALKQVLSFYSTVYGQGLGDPKLQQEAQGRDKAFAEFAQGRVGILAEGDYFWRDVINPQNGTAKMVDRNESVGFAMFPAIEPGKGVRGQSFVSLSGGPVTVLNPNTKNGKLAFELLAYMNSADMMKARTAITPEITSRTDVNKEVLKGDPLLSYIADRILPITVYRPSLAVYPQVSSALQEATANVVAGRTPDQAAADYQKRIEGIAGGPGNVSPR